jgi:hypothetical protein
MCAPQCSELSGQRVVPRLARAASSSASRVRMRASLSFTCPVSFLHSFCWAAKSAKAAARRASPAALADIRVSQFSFCMPCSVCVWGGGVGGWGRRPAAPCMGEGWV